jgi:hypothetical protein
MQHHQRQECTDAGGGQGGENRDGMDEALVEDAEHDVDGDDGRGDQIGLSGKRRLENLCGTLESCGQARRLGE